MQLKLRALEPEDIEFITEMENDEYSIKYSDRIAPLSRQSVKTYVMTCDPDPYSTGQLRLMITDEKGNRIGLLDYYEISIIHRRAQIGIILAPRYRGKGLSARVLKLGIKFAKERLLLENLGALISEGNQPSIRSFLTAGFLEKGRLEKWWRHHAGAEDCLIMQKTL